MTGTIFLTDQDIMDSLKIVIGDSSSIDFFSLIQLLVAKKIANNNNAQVTNIDGYVQKVWAGFLKQ